MGLIFIALTLLLPACGEQDAPSTPAYFIPPTISHRAEQIPLETPTPIIPTPVIACENDLAFVEDVTVLDNSYHAPGDVIEKVWLVKNTGTCNWDANYRIRFIDGATMEAELEQALFPARSNTEAEIRITFTVPDQSGLAYSTWQAYTPDGQPFGEQLWIQIIVDPDLVPTDTPLSTP